MGGKKKSLLRNDDVPVFLKKTYHMVDTCDPNIAIWSESGDAFVVKDPDKFASDVIPQFFKHNNFSSFVRQLNFYGFRKIKSDVLRINPAAIEDESKYWRFKHENFIRGRPDLLGEIRKANQINPANQHEVDQLKIEVCHLRQQMSSMSSEMSRLTSLVQQLTQTRDVHTEEPSHKKQKIQADVTTSTLPFEVPSMEKLTSIEIGDPIDSQVSLLDPHVSDMDLLVEDIPFELLGHESSQVSQKAKKTRPQKLADMFDFSNSEEDYSTNCASSTYPCADKTTSGVPRLVADRNTTTESDGKNCDDSTNNRRNVTVNDPLRQKMNDALTMLPEKLQESFVERMVQNCVDPEAYQKNVEAVTVLATAAAIEARNQQGITKNQGNGSCSGDFRDDDNRYNNANTVPVAAAALGAFLAKYGEAHKHCD